MAQVSHFLSICTQQNLQGPQGCIHLMALYHRYEDVGLQWTACHILMRYSLISGAWIYLSCMLERKWNISISPYLCLMFRMRRDAWKGRGSGLKSSLPLAVCLGKVSCLSALLSMRTIMMPKPESRKMALELSEHNRCTHSGQSQLSYFHQGKIIAQYHLCLAWIINTRFGSQLTLSMVFFSVHH